jgi:hypothetical protein
MGLHPRGRPRNILRMSINSNFNKSMPPYQKVKVPALTTTLIAALVECASAPSKIPQICSLEAILKNAYADKYVAEHGHVDLANAEISLAAARIAHAKGDDREVQHDLTMTEGHIVLGGIHGQQGRTRAENATVKGRKGRGTLCSPIQKQTLAADTVVTSRKQVTPLRHRIPAGAEWSSDGC